MAGVRGAAPGSAPSFVVAPPPSPEHAIQRPQLVARLQSLVDAHRVTLVVAPAGYGKTATLTAWARQSARPVAWLSLTPLDKHPQRLERGLLTALEPLFGTGAPDLAELLRQDLDESVLVIDDVHLLGAATAGVLGLVVDQAPPGLRLVLASRQRPLLRLQRLHAAGSLGTLGVDALGFSAAEISSAAARLDRRLTADQADALFALTAGWPVAVRLALLSGTTQTARLVTGGQLRLTTLTDYLIEEVLADLPPVLRDFLLSISVSDWITSPLAVELSGDPLAPAMIEDAIARGLPIERRGSLRGDPVYHWHPLVADQCRVLLRREDPARAQRLHRRCAELLVDVDEVLAARHALAAQSPELARDIVSRHWLPVLLRGDFAALEELCLQLPAPWSDDPDVVAIRATCRSAADDHVRAEQLRRRAQALTQSADPAARGRHELTCALADLLIPGSAAELFASCQRVRTLLTETSRLGDSVRACGWFLVGFAEVRLRRTRTAAPALREAAALARAGGLDDIADRAQANLAFSLAFNGDFAGAQGLLEIAPGEEAAWRRTEGRPEWFASAWMCFWRDEVDQADQLFAACIEAGGAMTSFATMARVWRAVLAAASSDPTRRQTAADELAAVSDAPVQGMPFQVYKAVARALLELAERRPESAVELLDAVLPGATDIPASLVVAAEIYVACGQPDRARTCLLALAEVDTVASYVRVAADVVEALLADSADEHDKAHAVLERALTLAAPDRILRPFARSDPRLAELLIAHARRGTDHQQLIAEALVRRGERDPVAAPNGQALSSREREVLGYLQSSMEGREIAAAMFISPNTLKTHQRSLYRKLGVSNRREAVRASLGRTSLSGASVSPTTDQ